MRMRAARMALQRLMRQSLVMTHSHGTRPALSAWMQAMRHGSIATVTTRIKR